MGIVWILFILILEVGPSNAQSFCAVTLHVKDSKGNPLERSVRLLDSNGTVETYRTSKNGLVTFCDFRYGIHSIVVAPDDCMPVVLQNIQIVPHAPQTVHVVVNSCSSYPYWISRKSDRQLAACIVQVRVRAMTGEGLFGVSITPQGPDPVMALAPVEKGRDSSPFPTTMPIPSSIETDSYGRAWLITSNGAQTKLIIVREGYKEKTVEVSPGLKHP